MKTPEEIVEALARWSAKYRRQGGIYPFSAKIDDQLIEIEQAAKVWLKKEQQRSGCREIQTKCRTIFVSNCEKCNKAFEVQPGLQTRKHPELCEACAALVEQAPGEEKFWCTENRLNDGELCSVQCKGCITLSILP